MVKLSKSADETQKIAFEFAKTVKSGEIILLQGEMGAGKTVFAKGFAKGLGIKDTVTSPTYILMNDYDGKLYHFDFYRLSSGGEAEALGLDEYFYLGGICLIEWGDKIKSILPPTYRTVTIKKISEKVREINLK